MALRTTLVTLATTTTVAAAAAGWWAVSSPSGSAPDGGAPAAAAAATGAGSDSLVCVGPDGVLRAAGPGATCRPDHRALRLQDDDDRLCETCDPFKEEEPDDRRENRELDALEARIAALENAPYFEVISKAGATVFSIGPGGLRFYNHQGRAMAVIGTSEAGAHFTARSGSTSAVVSFGASEKTAGIRIEEDGLLRMELTSREGRSALRLPSGSGLIAGIGESAAGTGALLVGTRAGAVRGAFTVNDWGGTITVSRGDKGGLSLSEAGIGGGVLDISDAQDNSVVRMGHVGHRYGIVMTGPVMGFPLVPKSGLPGSYFLGCGSAAPPACVPSIQ